jgi:hypothetical protein
MNDRISSARVFGNAVVTVYRDPNLRGQAKVIDRNVADLRGMGFNDRVSSYVVDAGLDRARNRNGNGNVYGDPRQSNASRWSDREAEAMVRRGYQSVLGRNPDPEGLRSWTRQVMNRNWNQRDLEFALRQSDEYRMSRNPGRAVPRSSRWQ